MRRQLFISAVCMALLASCADTDMVQMGMDEPETLAAYDYMKQYGALKDYATFGIGANVDVAALTDGGMEYRIAVGNFSTLVPGTAFTHGAMVKASGALNTTTVSDIMESAAEKGMSVTGGPLVWSERQNSTYLNGRLDPNVIRPDGDEGGYCIKVTNNVSGKMTDAQVAYTFARTPQVEPGVKYKMTFWVRGTAEGTIQCATYSDGKGSRFTPTVNVTREWAQVEMTNSMATGIKGLKQVLFNIGSYVGTLFIDDIKFYEASYDERDNLNTLNTNLDDPEATADALSVLTDTNKGIEDLGVSLLGEGYDPLATYVDKTDEEKATIIRGEMTKFIADVTGEYGGNVHEWDVVCWPLDDTDPTQLRSGTGKQLAGGEFYWQDYLGRDYAVFAFNDAAQNTADGDRLFIRENNLAGNAAKQDALISYISYIESQGARIDGIGVDIDTSVGSPNISGIGAMLGKLAATGKLVKISALTIGLGDDVTTDIVTEEQLKAQGEAYRTVIKAYMDNVPEAQRAGIVQGNLIDGTLPMGLWASDWSRKHAYGGFVKGLRQE